MAESILVTGKKISSMELVTNVTGNEKIPTGQPNDLAVTPNQIADHTIARGDLASQEDLSQVEVSLGTQITDLANDVAAEDNSIRGLIAAEEAARIAGDNSLQAAIDSVDASLRSTLDAEIAAEEAARISGDNNLQDAIGVESVVRANADAELQSNLDGEVAARIAADALKVDKEGSVSSVAGRVGDVTLEPSDVLIEGFGSQRDVNDVLLGAVADRYTKSEVDYALNTKANKSDTYTRVETDAALSQLSTLAVKFYPTLAEANADIANVEVNQPVQVGEAEDGGLWYKATAGASSLTRSAYDPLTQARVDINKKISGGSVNQFNLEYLLTKTPTAIGGFVERIITPDSVKFKYTQTADTGVNGIGFNFDNKGVNVSCTIKIPTNVMTTAYISQWQGSTNLNANIPLVSLGNGVFSVQNATPLPEATSLRLFVRTMNNVGESFEIDQIDFVYDAYSRYVDESASRAALLKSNTENLINASELLGLAPFQVSNASNISTQVNEQGDLIGTITKTTNATHNAGTRIDISNIDKISFGIWVKDNPNFINVELWKDSTPPAHVTLSTPNYSKDGWNFYSAYGVDVSEFSTYEFRVRFNGEATDTQFKNPVFTTNPYSVNWIPQELSEVSKNAIVAEAVDAISPILPDMADISNNFIKLEELVGLDLPSHRSNAKDILVEQDAGLTKYKWKATNAPTVSVLGFWVDRNSKSDKISASIFVRNTPSFLSVVLQQFDSSGATVSPTTTLVKVSDDGTYSKYSASNVTVNALTARFRLYVRMTGVVDELYEFYSPIVSMNNITTEVGQITPSFVARIMGDPEANEDKFNNIAQAVAWIKNPLIHSGAEIQSDGSVLDVFDQRYFSIWGSSSAANFYSRLNTYAINTLGCESTFNGGKGGESSDLISARMGARPCRILFANGFIPASGSIEVQHTLGLGFGLPNLKAFSGKVSVFDIEGTLSYDSSVSSNLIFTRTTAGSSISVPSTMYFDFIPNFDQKYLSGYGIVWVGKNDIGWGNQFGSEELLQRTIEVFSQFKPLFKRTLVLDHWANTSWDQDAKWIEVQKINSLLKQYFGKYLFSVHDYIMSDQVWVDTGITPTPADLILQSKRMLASSLSPDGQHLNAAVNDQLILKLDAKYRELGWI